MNTKFAIGSLWRMPAILINDKPSYPLGPPLWIDWSPTFFKDMGMPRRNKDYYFITPGSTVLKLSEAILENHMHKTTIHKVLVTFTSGEVKSGWITEVVAAELLPVFAVNYPKEKVPVAEDF